MGKSLGLILGLAAVGVVAFVLFKRGAGGGVPAAAPGATVVVQGGGKPASTNSNDLILGLANAGVSAYGTWQSAHPPDKSQSTATTTASASKSVK